MQAKPRVVLDTNLFISGLISPTGTPHQLLRLWEEEQITLLTSAELISEVARVLQRPAIRQKYHLDDKRISALVTSLSQATESVTPQTSLPVHSRDPKDDKLLALALGGNADYLITGDNDLLVLDGDPALEHLRIITAALFLQEEL
jgi:putative PIN family toxin of toxin-antitoxin system